MNPAFAKHKGISSRQALSEEVFTREAHAYRLYVMAANGLTVRDVCQATGESKQYVSLVLSGTRRMRLPRGRRVREFIAKKVGKHSRTLWPIYNRDAYYRWGSSQ